MTQFSDAAMLKGDYAEMLKEPPKESEWEKTSCENSAEAAAQEIAKHIFAMRQGLDPAIERLEVITFSALGPVRVMGIVPGEGDLIRIDAMMPDTGAPVSMVQHISQLSLSFSKAIIQKPADTEGIVEVDDDGLADWVCDF